MSKIKFLSCLLMYTCFCVQVVQAKHLPGPMEFVVHGHSLPKDSYGIYIREIGKADPILSFNPDKSLNPASVIKVITTLAALEILGPAWYWDTEVYLRGNVRNGILDGDIVLRGTGDPYLTTTELWKMLRELRRRGIKQINGDLVIDDSYFQLDHINPGKFDKKPLRTYNVQPNAMLVNFKAAYFHFYPAMDGRRVTVAVDPHLPNLTIENRLRQRRSGCYGYQRGVSVSVPNPPASDRIIFEGRFPSGCERYVMARTVLQHHTYAYGVFRSLWEELGGSLGGSVKHGTVSEDEEPHLVWHARSLSDVIKLVNKYSNNVMTRQLLLTMAAELKGVPGTVANGRQVIDEFLHGHNLQTNTLTIPNGSGLSREARISARLLSDILQLGHDSLFQSEFESSLSIIGLDGTARHRMKNRKQSGHAHVKTGTIDHVSAIGGYVRSKKGKKYIVAAIVNHEDVHRGPGEELMNAIIRWTWSQ